MSARLGVTQMRTAGRRTPLVPPEEALPVVSDPEVGPLVASVTGHYLQGDQASVRRQLLAIAERYGTKDLIVVTNCYAFEDRVRSFELVTDAFDLRPVGNRCPFGCRARLPSLRSRDGHVGYNFRDRAP